MIAREIAPASPAATHRPATVTAALALLVLLALVALFPTPGAEEIPPAILLAGYAFAALQLVAAAGLWRCRRWAALLGFVVVLLDGLAAAVYRPDTRAPARRDHHRAPQPRGASADRAPGLAPRLRLSATAPPGYPPPSAGRSHSR